MSRTKINLSKQISIDANVAPDTSGLYTLGSASLKWGDLFLDDAAVVNFNGDVLMTHSSNTLTISGGTLATAALTSTTITASGIIKTDDATEATTTTDGSLQTDGGLSVVKSAVIGDDLDLLSNLAVFKVGDDQPFTLTHSNANNTLLATADHRLAFGHADEYITGTGTHLDIVSGDEIRLSATTDVVIPANVGLHLGNGNSKLESDNTDLTITSTGGDINLTAGSSADVRIPVNVGLKFGGDAQGIEADGSSGNLTLSAGTDLIVAPSGGNLKPNSDNQVALGENNTGFSDLFLGSGAVVNFHAGAQQLTHGIVHTLASDIKDDHAASISQTSLTSSQSSISFVSLGSDIKSSIGLQLGNATFTSSTSAIEFIELGSDISSVHAGNIVGSFLGTSTSSINFGSDSNAASFNSALNSARKVRFDDGTFVVDFTFGSYSGSGSSLTVSSAVGISDATVSSLNVSNLGGSGTMKPVAGSSTNAAAFNSSNPGVTIRIDVSGGTSMEYALGSYSSGTSITVASATARSGSSIAIGSINDSGGSIKVVSASTSAASTFDSALASGRKMEFSDGTDKIIFTFSALGGGQSSLSISAQEQTAGSGAVSVASLISGGHMKNVTASTSILDIGPSAVTDLIRVGGDDVVFKDGAYDVDVASHDGSNGLKLGGTLVTATAAELNYTDVTTLGTSQASKVVTADASGDITIAGAAANVVWDKSADALEFADNASAEFGTGLDMKIYHDSSNSYITNAVGALKLATETSGIAVTIGHSTSEVTVADNLTIAGNLTVQGTTTSVDSTTINISQSFTFEGPADDHETTLHAGTPTQDLQINLPQFSGSAGAATYHLPVLVDATTAASALVTAAEFALLDGGSTVGTTALASGDGFLHNDGGTMKQTSIDKIADLFAGTGIAASSGVLSLDIDELSALGSAALHQTQDHFAFSDNGTEKKITFSNLQDAVFADVSGDATVAAGGALTIASASVQAGMINTDFAGQGLEVMGAGVLRIAAAAAGDGLSGGAGSALAIDLNELTAASVAVASDSIAIIDADDNSSKKESIADLMEAVAGSGLSATSGSLSVDLSEIGAQTIDVAADTFLFIDEGASGDPTKKESIADLMTAVAGNGLVATSGVLSVVAYEQFFNSSSMGQSGAGETAVAGALHATASLNLETAVVSNSLEVYLNGLLQMKSGSISGHPGDAYDYKVSGTVVQMRDALDSNDLLVVKYVQKN